LKSSARKAASTDRHEHTRMNNSSETVPVIDPNVADRARSKASLSSADFCPKNNIKEPKGDSNGKAHDLITGRPASTSPQELPEPVEVSIEKLNPSWNLLKDMASLIVEKRKTAENLKSSDSKKEKFGEVSDAQQYLSDDSRESDFYATYQSQSTNHPNFNCDNKINEFNESHSFVVKSDDDSADSRESNFYSPSKTFEEASEETDENEVEKSQDCKDDNVEKTASEMPLAVSSLPPESTEVVETLEKSKALMGNILKSNNPTLTPIQDDTFSTGGLEDEQLEAAAQTVADALLYAHSQDPNQRNPVTDIAQPSYIPYETSIVAKSDLDQSYIRPIEKLQQEHKLSYGLKTKSLPPISLTYSEELDDIQKQGLCAISVRQLELARSKSYSDKEYSDRDEDVDERYTTRRGMSPSRRLTDNHYDERKKFEDYDGTNTYDHHNGDGNDETSSDDEYSRSQSYSRSRSKQGGHRHHRKGRRSCRKDVHISESESSSDEEYINQNQNGQLRSYDVRNFVEDNSNVGYNEGCFFGCW